MPGSHLPAAEYTTKDKHIGLYGILKGKKQLHDIPDVWEHEVCI